MLAAVGSAPFVVPTLLLAAVLLVSALAKLGDTDATADAIVSLRLPRALVTMRVPRILPWLELLLAAGLLLGPRPGYAAAAAAALALVAAYLVVLARALTFAEPVSCACFGRLTLGEITRLTVVRNAVLVLLAAAALVDALRHGSVLARLGDLDGTGGTWVGMAALSASVTALVLHAGRAEPRGGASSLAPAMTRPAPIVGTVVTRAGERVTLGGLAESAPRLLVFLSLTCGSCLRVLDRLPGFVADTPWIATHAVLASDAAARQVPETLEPLVDPHGALRAALGVRSPCAVLLDGDARPADGPAVGFDEVTALLARLRAGAGG